MGEPALWGSRRRRAGERLARLAGAVNGLTYLGLDYPPAADLPPRWGWGRPGHPELTRLLEQGHDVYRSELEKILANRAQLLDIPRESKNPLEPVYIQEPVWLPGLDMASLYTYTRERAPACYLEVGSGMSTRVVARARRDAGLDTKITSIDPSPRSGIDTLCDTVVRQPMESVREDVFAGLEAGDMVFFDGSHRVFPNSDATVFFLDVLPRLPAGLLVGVHDIMLPWDYPSAWNHRYYSEQYLLAAMLLSGAPLRPLLPCFYAGVADELSNVLDPLWQAPGLAEIDKRGFAFWFETTGA